MKFQNFNILYKIEVLMVLIVFNPTNAFRHDFTSSMLIFSKCLRLQGVKIVLRSANSRLYNQLNYQWNTFNQIEPLAYVLPTSTVQVQVAIRCSNLENIKISIKSGGHSYEKYSFGNNDTVVVDLQKLNNMEINSSTSTALIGPGALLANIFYHFWKNGNYVFVGGECVSVGFGGFALGGGYGVLSKRFGLAADNILEVTMVTATGDALTVNLQEYPDLFWALRGAGGGNFGIVTDFKVRVYNAADIRYNYVTLDYTPSQFGSVFNAFQKHCRRNIQGTTFMYLNLNSTVIILEIFGTNLSATKLNKIVARFPTPNQKTVALYSKYVDLVTQLKFATTVPNVGQLKTYTRLTKAREYRKAKSYFTRNLVPRAKYLELGNVLRRIPDNSEVYFSTFGGATNRVKANATAFVHRNALFLTEIKLGSNSDATTSWVGQMESVMTKLDDGESYQNFPDEDLKDYLPRYYASNLEHLREIKGKYDPTNYFSFPQSINY